METYRNVTAIILAGGNNSRIGRNKAMLNVGSISFIEYVINQIRPLFGEIIISSNEPALYKELSCRIITDKSEGQGPLMGIYSCLLEMQNDIAFVSTCDVPELNLPFLNKLLSYSQNYDIVVPILSDGKYEPLFAVYNKTGISAIEKILNSERRKISLIFNELNVKYVPLNDLTWYHNINTEEDYREFIDKIE